MEEVSSVRITTLVDNTIWKQRLASSWGLSFYMEMFKDHEKHTVLMNTSGSFITLFSNSTKLGVGLSSVEAVFITHWHRDHCSALAQVLSLMKRSIPIYIPPGTPREIMWIREAGGVPTVCSEPIEFLEGMMSTGEMQGGIREHSLLINLKDIGLVVLTGCSHPGLIRILQRARTVSGISKIHAVIGGFHISGTGEGEKIGKLLHKMDVRLVSPCHCTHRNAKIAIRKVMGSRYVQNGSGRIISIPL